MSGWRPAGGQGIKTIIFAETKAEANELSLNSGFSGDCQGTHFSSSCNPGHVLLLLLRVPSSSVQCYRGRVALVSSRLTVSLPTYPQSCTVISPKPSGR